MRVLLVGGSIEPSSPGLVARLAGQADHVVAIDRGLDVLLAAGLGCDLFCGDADSVSDPGAAFARACEAGEPSPVGEVERYNPHKDFTDLSLALRTVAERWGGAELACTCVSGGKPDHALAVVGRLASWGGDVELVEDGFTGGVLHAGGARHLGGAAGRRFSFVPVSEGARVTLSGMRWDLDSEPVGLLSDLGISNVVESDRALVKCGSGTLIWWLFD